MKVNAATHSAASLLRANRRWLLATTENLDKPRICRPTTDPVTRPGPTILGGHPHLLFDWLGVGLTRVGDEQFDDTAHGHDS